MAVERPRVSFADLPPGTQLLPMVTFEEIREAGRDQGWRLDHTALKSIRFQGENPPGNYCAQPSGGAASESGLETVQKKKRKLRRQVALCPSEPAWIGLRTPG